MDAWIIWLIVAVALVALEVLTQMVWTLCMAVGCAGGAIASLCGADAVWQTITMALVSVVAYIVLMPLFKRWHEKHGRRSGHDDRTGMDALLGRKAVVTERIVPGMTGRARIDGDSWQVRVAGLEVPVEAGTEVIVTGYDSIILDVQLPVK